MKKLALFLALMSLPSMAGSFTSLGGGNPEGTAVKSTGESSGLVLTSDGADGAAWGSVAGTGDVVGPAASVDSEIALFSSTTGKLLKRASGTGVCKATSGVASFATIVNADVSASAAIARSKFATGNTNRLVVNDGSTGAMTDASAITASRVLISDANGIPTHSTVTSTTLGYLDATSSIQTQLNGKEASITTLSVAKGGTNSGTALNNNRVMKSSGDAIVEAAAITANRALISDSNGIPTHSSVTNTELGYLSGVTGAIQTALDALKVGHLAGFIENPSAKTYVLDQYAKFAYTINDITIDLGSGTVSAALQIDGVDVTSCTGISASTTESTTTCTGANSVSAGNTVTMTLSSASSPVDLAFTLKYTR